jgi:hypothetical protein
VSEAAADADQEFTFKVHIDDLSEEGSNAEYRGIRFNKGSNDEHIGIKFNGGEASVTLKGGEKVEIDGLPYGVTYTVTEEACSGFATTKSGDTGTISATDSVAEFTNTRTLGELEVSKTVVSDVAAD